MDATPGAQKYSGFGVGILTEAEMLDEMARAYNADRTERDYELLVTTFGAEKAKAKQPTQTWKSLYDSMWFYEIPKENRAWIGFPDQVTASDILKEPPRTIGTVTRTGGFQTGVGKKLDAAAVTQERNASVLVK
jgi:hypothetical protein